MKIVMYGASICPDCVGVRAQLEKRSDIEFDYREITKNTTLLKEFLSYRDHEKIFASVIESGKIGIPFFILEDGRKTFEIDDYIDMETANVEQEENSCSIDGKGRC